MISIIVAKAENDAIGKDNQLLWHLPEDLKFFKNTTMGKTVIMGRKNYDSIPAKYAPLKGRRNIVLTKNKNLEIKDVDIFNDLNQALSTCNLENETFIIGGAQIYDLALKTLPIKRLYVTNVHKEYPNADAFFPKINFKDWKQIWEHYHPSNEKNPIDFTIQIWGKD